MENKDQVRLGQIPGTAAQAGLVAECIFLLETVCPDSLGADRFLAPTPLKAVVNHSGEILNEKFDDTKVKDGNRKWLKA